MWDESGKGGSWGLKLEFFCGVVSWGRGSSRVFRDFIVEEVSGVWVGFFIF